MVKRLVNDYRLANSYIVDVGNNQVVIIDVGGPNIENILNELNKDVKNIVAIILTHEHADHCCGLASLYDVKSFKLYCTENCYKNAKNSKRNYSFYTDDIETFQLDIDAIFLRDGEVLSLGKKQFKVIETPGHSPGSICLQVDNSLFTGDTILNDTRTLLTLPDSDKNQYRESIKKLGKIMKKGFTIFPGHGEPFTFIELEKLQL